MRRSNGAEREMRVGFAALMVPPGDMTMAPRIGEAIGNAPLPGITPADPAPAGAVIVQKAGPEPQGQATIPDRIEQGRLRALALALPLDQPTRPAHVSPRADERDKAPAETGPELPPVAGDILVPLVVPPTAPPDSPLPAPNGITPSPPGAGTRPLPAASDQSEDAPLSERQGDTRPITGEPHAAAPRGMADTVLTAPSRPEAIPAAVGAVAPTPQSTAPQTFPAAPPTLDTSRPDWPATLVEEIRQRRDGQMRQVDLVLMPDRLGRVEVQIGLSEGTATIRIVTETPEAARLFTDAQHRLSEMMTRAGLDLAGHQAGTSTGGGHGHERGTTRGLPQTSPDGGTDPDAAVPTYLFRPEGRIDLIA
ncbi:flagellar hook-length control protein FliK [Rhodovulum bhavnagarense]|nr:flagellar hook-length control protein FliK [Rhodovulum bhavnagarense]